MTWCLARCRRKSLRLVSSLISGPTGGMRKGSVAWAGASSSRLFQQLGSLPLGCARKRKGHGESGQEEADVADLSNDRVGRACFVACFLFQAKRSRGWWDIGSGELVDLAVVGNEPRLGWQIKADCSPESLASQICSTATSSLAPMQFLQLCFPHVQLGPTIWKTSLASLLSGSVPNERGLCSKSGWRLATDKVTLVTPEHHHSITMT